MNNPLSLLEFKEEFEAVKREFPDLLSSPNWPEDEKKLADELLLSIFWKELNVFEKYILKWEKGLFMPSEEELRELKNYQENFAEVVSFFDGLIEKKSSSENLEKEKEVAKKNKEKLDELLKNDEYRQKAEELLKKYKDNPPLSDNNSDKDIENKFNEQITNLQNQIKDLENKQNQDSGLERDHKYKKELERLKAELEELKNKQKDKVKPQKEDKGQNKKNDFPTGLVVGGGIAIFVLLVVIILLVKRNNK